MRDKVIFPRSQRKSVRLPEISFRNPEQKQGRKNFSSQPILNDRDTENGKESHASQKVGFVLALYQHGVKVELQPLLQHSRICLRPMYCERIPTLTLLHTINYLPVPQNLSGEACFDIFCPETLSPPNALQFHPHSGSGLPSFRSGLL